MGRAVAMWDVPEATEQSRARDRDGNAAGAAAEERGFGALQTSRGCLPLLSLDVQARIAGLTAAVTVRQCFFNAHTEPLEAIYIFPLPDRAAVTEFRLKVAGRVVVGELQERAAAREVYQQALQAGHRAALAEEDRPGVFQMRVGNLPPGELAEVELTLVGPLAYVAGEAEFRFPLVVAPRYVPGNPLPGPQAGEGIAQDTNQVPDASRISPPVLLPGFPSPVRLGLEVEIDPAGFPWQAETFWPGLKCSLHSILEEAGPPWRVRLQPGEKLNRDFLLRFPVAQERVASSLQALPGVAGQPGTFALTIVPPRVAEHPQKPRDVVFVLDRSGSMGGWKMVAARRAVARMVDTLAEQDRFSVLLFDTDIEFPPDAPRAVFPATNRSRWHVVQWLANVRERGGTEMGPALHLAMQLLQPTSEDRERMLVLVTDGQVAGEDVLLQTLQTAAGGNLPRIFTLGIDRAVNAGFLNRLALLGKGFCELVESEERLDEVLDRVHRQIGTPALVDVTLRSPSRSTVDHVTPSGRNNLFADSPLTIYGQFTGPVETFALEVTAKDAAERPWSQTLPAQPVANPAVRSLWGRARVRELEDEYLSPKLRALDVLEREIVQVSLAAQVLSRFTAFVAVDRVEVVNQGGEQQQVVQPVELPEGSSQELLCGGAAGSAGHIQELFDAVVMKSKSESSSAGPGADSLRKALAARSAPRGHDKRREAAPQAPSEQEKPRSGRYKSLGRPPAPCSVPPVPARPASPVPPPRGTDKSAFSGTDRACMMPASGSGDSGSGTSDLLKNLGRLNPFGAIKRWLTGNQEKLAQPEDLTKLSLEQLILEGQRLTQVSLAASKRVGTWTNDQRLVVYAKLARILEELKNRFAQRPDDRESRRRIEDLLGRTQDLSSQVPSHEAKDREVAWLQDAQQLWHDLASGAQPGPRKFWK